MAKNLKKTEEKTVRIKLPRISGKPNAVFVSVGDRQWRIMRGVEVEIPACAYDVLINSELAEDAAVRYEEHVSE